MNNGRWHPLIQARAAIRQGMREPLQTYRPENQLRLWGDKGSSGTKNGQYQLLTYQIRGASSSGGLPNWRRVNLDDVSNLTILSEGFPGKRETPSGQHAAFDEVILIVADW